MATAKDHKECCSICLETIDDRKCQPTMTTCAHLFCRVCLRRALEIKPFCPICRTYQRRSGNDTEEPNVLDQNVQWNPQIVRAFLSQEVDSNGMRRVCLSDGEETNIYVDPKVKIRVDPNVNLVINGKKVEDPSACSQQ